MHEFHGQYVGEPAPPVNAEDAPAPGFPGTESIEAPHADAEASAPKGPTRAERKAARLAAAGSSPSRFPWDTRVKLAIALSFVILVALLIVNRPRIKARDTKETPQLSLGGKGVPPGKPAPKPEKDPDKPNAPEKSPKDPEGEPKTPPDDPRAPDDNTPIPAADSKGQPTQSPTSDALPEPADGPPAQGDKNGKTGDTPAPTEEAPAKGAVVDKAGESPRNGAGDRQREPELPPPEDKPSLNDKPTPSDSPPPPVEEPGKPAGTGADKKDVPAPDEPPASSVPGDKPAPPSDSPSAPAPNENKSPPDAPPAGDPKSEERVPDPGTAKPSLPALSTPPPTPDAAPAVEPSRPENASGEGYAIPSAGLTRGEGGTTAAKAIATERAAPSSAQPAVIPASVAGGAEDGTIHVVRKGENFWTISRYHYASGRFYKALWYANRDLAKTPEDLYVGTAIRIPAVEDLKRELIETPKPTRGNVASSRGPESAAPSRRDLKAERASSRPEAGMALPAADPAKRPLVAKAPPPGPAYRSYVVRGGNETLRSIARDQLGDADREDEIIRLNRDQLDEDTYRLKAGMALKLPNETRRR